MNRKHVVIVGGGFSGTIVAYLLAQKSNDPIKITLLDRGPKFGKGIAYSTNDDCHLLNVPAQGMSAIHDNPNHFVNWLKENSLFSDNRSFYPRSWYGDYLASLLTEAMDLSFREPDRLELELIVDECREMKESACGKLEIISSQGRNFLADSVVLALGHFPPGQFGKFSLFQNPRFIQRFWTSAIFPLIPKRARVAILGTGLSMVDALVSFQERGHEGNIVAFSRNGLISREHGKKLPNFSLELTPGTLSVRDALGLFREQKSKAERLGGTWRDAIDSFRPHTNKIWSVWSWKEKKRFLRHLRPLWEVHRHRMAQEIALRVNQSIQSEALRIVAARIENIIFADGKFQISFRRKGESSISSLGFDYIIDCSGPESDFRRLNDPFLQSILTNFPVQIDESGMGISTDDAGSFPCRGAGKAFCIGPIRKGRLFETTAVPELRIQAFRIAEEIVGLC